MALMIEVLAPCQMAACAGTRDAQVSGGEMVDEVVAFSVGSSSWLTNPPSGTEAFADRRCYMSGQGQRKP